MYILVVNGGSTSYKFACFEWRENASHPPLWKAVIEEGAEGYFSFTWQSSQEKKEGRVQGEREGVIWTLLSSLWSAPYPSVKGKESIAVIGHRIVHGGAGFNEPVFIAESTKEQIASLIPLAPLHQPFHIQMIEWFQKHFPNTPQLAVFDTSFHRTMPDHVQTYPISLTWKKKGILRYGFHGISHQYSLERAAFLLHQARDQFKMISCHLGGGCSLCAIREGQSYETTMGFTPLEGLMMGTRCGSIDPGILFYLMREEHINAEQLEKMLTYDSGLKGVSGSFDMRDILQNQERPECALAKEMFVHRLKAAIGAMAASIGGIDVLSFTGGIGEGAALIREEVVAGLGFLGAHLDREKNRLSLLDTDIATPQSSVRLFVIKSQEEWMIAKACFAKMI